MAPTTRQQTHQKLSKLNRKMRRRRRRQARQARKDQAKVSAQNGTLKRAIIVLGKEEDKKQLSYDVELDEAHGVYYRTVKTLHTLVTCYYVRTYRE